MLPMSDGRGAVYGEDTINTVRLRSGGNGIGTCAGVRSIKRASKKEDVREIGDLVRKYETIWFE